MSFDQMLIMAILLSAMATFVWGRWRRDMVALDARRRHSHDPVGLTPVNQESYPDH